MTDNELRRLNRSELLELMISLSEENEKLRGQLEQQKTRLESRTILINNSGSIAEAALSLSGIFKAAQEAADIYLENACRIKEDSQKEADDMLAATQRRCAEMLELAQRETDKQWEPLRAIMERYVEAHQELKDVLGSYGKEIQ